MKRASRREHGPRRPKVTLAELRTRNPEAWQLFHAILQRWIAQSPEVSREFAADGVPGEAMLEQCEALVDAGLLKIFRDRRGLWMGVWEPAERRYISVGGGRP